MKVYTNTNDVLYQMHLSVAIPTMNRWRFLKNMLPVYLESKYIDRIAICDETGSDIEEIKKHYGTHVSSGKIFLQKNKTRLGPYLNKYECLKRTGKGWIALLDSDNIFTDEQFFAPVAKLLESAEFNTIYAPAAVMFIKEDTGETEMPFLKYDGLVVDKSNWSDIVATPEGRRLLNDGNYVLYGNSARHHWKWLDSTKTRGADTLIANYYLVAQGISIRFTKELGYTHVVHAGSITEAEHSETESILADPKWRILPDEESHERFIVLG